MRESKDDTSQRDDGLLDKLRRLPERDAGPRLAAQVARRARAIVDERRAMQDRPLTRLLHAWSRALVPALMVGTACVYLGWVLRFAVLSYR